MGEFRSAEWDRDLPAWHEILRWPLPDSVAIDRWLIRTLGLVARNQIGSVSGLEHIRPEHDPFVLVANHSSRREALLLPALLILHRRGQLIHFLADWNFRLIPGVGFLYRRGGTITVGRKPARPRFLNHLKPFLTDPQPAIQRARSHVEAGKSVGMFPEGTVNRDRSRLLPGRYGAARLSLETGVPVVPVGIRFAEEMNIQIGAPLVPPASAGGAMPADLRAWHGAIMTEIARLSGKEWPQRREHRHDPG